MTEEPAIFKPPVSPVSPACNRNTSHQSHRIGAVFIAVLSAPGEFGNARNAMSFHIYNVRTVKEENIFNSVMIIVVVNSDVNKDSTLKAKTRTKDLTVKDKATTKD